jgi:hypothetical protein
MQKFEGFKVLVVDDSNLSRESDAVDIVKVNMYLYCVFLKIN